MIKLMNTVFDTHHAKHSIQVRQLSMTQLRKQILVRFAALGQQVRLHGCSLYLVPENNTRVTNT